MLHCCSMVNYHISKNKPEKMLDYLKIACIDSVLLIDFSDNHYKQVELNLDNSFIYVRKLFSREVTDTYEQFIIALKTRNLNLIDGKYLSTDLPEVIFTFNLHRT